jgi:hypothetical protein
MDSQKGEQHKCTRLDVCLLNRYPIESDDVLRPIITGDETWIQNYDAETKRRDVE